MKKALPGILFLLCCASVQVNAQNIGIKTNLFYDATTTLNLGVEAGLSPSWSADLSANYNPWTFKENKKWKHFLVQPELRYWTNRVFKGHFFGVHALGGKYNAGNIHLPFGVYKDLRTERHQGWLAGAGLAYGYAWTLGCRWGLEAEIGLGYVHADYDRYRCKECGTELGEGTRNYIGPTKLALNLVYVIGGREGCLTKKELAAQAAYEHQLAAKREEQEREANQARKRKEEAEANRLAEEARIRETALAEAKKAEEEARRPKETQQEGSVYFVVGQTAMRNGYKGNGQELERMKQLMAELHADTNVTITGITLTAYASPEGSTARNEQLSRRRAAHVLNYCKEHLGQDEALFTTVIAGEDWQELAERIGKSQIPEKDEILQIIGIKDVDKRKANLERLNGGRPYIKLLREVYPDLRRVVCRIQYTVKN